MESDNETEEMSSAEQDQHAKIALGVDADA